MEPTVSILIEIPESLHKALMKHLSVSNHDQDKTWILAICMYLMQNSQIASGADYGAVSRHYKNTLYGVERN